MILERAEDLDRRAVVAVAHGEPLELGPGLLAVLERSRATTLAALSDAGPVYGVSTGMGLQSHLAVGTEDQASYQSGLMLARAVGSEPWLDARSVRAAVATRLRTLLAPEAGVSPALAVAVAGLLDRDVALPAGGSGAAGEIVPLAHLGQALVDAGQPLGPKEGVALLQGVPVSTGRALLLAHDARVLSGQVLAVVAAEHALVRAPRDPWHPALSRGDVLLDRVDALLRELAGPEPASRMLQAPVSFRVADRAVVALLRAAGHLDAAAERALSGVTTSPALVDGRFLGTAGFDGFEVAAGLDALRVAAIHLAETGAARLHRMLDPRVTGLPAQLSPEPGRHTGLVAVHKRAVGRVHHLRRTAAPAAVGATETSLGQEDVQSFGLEAATALDDALAGLRDVTACELLAVHRATLLDPSRPQGSERLKMVLQQGFASLPTDTGDRAFGRDVGVLVHDLGVGWAADVLGDVDDARSA